MISPALALALCLARPAPEVRPTLSGPIIERLTADGRVKIHYTLEGADRLPDMLDVDPANGVPDTVDWVEEGAARMLDTFVDVDGWPAPPDDGIRGGDGRLDIYLKDIDANGYAYWREDAGYIEIAPHRKVEYTKEAFESIVGHEVHHVLEFAAGELAGASWLLEATATWAQYLVFTGDEQVKLAQGFLWFLRLSHPERALDYEGFGDLHEYAGMIWLKYVVDRGGGARTLVLELYRAIAAEQSSVRGHDRFARERLPGLTSLADMAVDHALWNVFACAADDGRHYDAARAGCAGIGGRVAALEIAAPGGRDSVPIDELGTGFLALPPDCTSADLKVTVIPTRAMKIQVVGVAAVGESTVVARDGQAGVPVIVDVPAWGHLRRVMVGGTNLGFVQASFHVTAAVSGSYAPPATLPAPTALALEPATLALTEGDEGTARVLATYGTCADGGDVSATAVWHSSDEDVVRVVAGRVGAVGPGTADIHATAGALASNRVTVTVTAGPASSGCAVGARGGSPVIVLLLLALLLYRKTTSAPTGMRS